MVWNGHPGAVVADAPNLRFTKTRYCRSAFKSIPSAWHFL